MGIIGRILAFLIMGTVGLLAIAMPIYIVAFTSQATSGAQPTGGVIFEVMSPFLIVAVVAAFIVMFAPTARHAWGRLALIDGLACFALPFMAAALSWVVGSHVVQSAGTNVGAAAAGAGAGLAGVAMTGAAGFMGFFAGLILVVMAYFILRGAR
jgi:hypothetical protein